MDKIFKPSLLLLITLLATACKADITRNDDGTLTVKTEIMQQQLQEVIASISDPLVKDLTVSLQSGYVLVSGKRQRLNDARKSDTLTFRLDLSVSNGQPTAVISNAQVDGVSFEQNRVDNWNQTISNRLSNFGGKNDQATLQAIGITPESVTMTWNVSKQ